MIDWAAFASVAAASLVSALTVVAFYSIALRLLPDAGAANFTARRVGAIACFVVCGLAVAFGVYLIVPAFH